MYMTRFIAPGDTDELVNSNLSLVPLGTPRSAYGKYEALDKMYVNWLLDVMAGIWLSRDTFALCSKPYQNQTRKLKPLWTL